MYIDTHIDWKLKSNQVPNSVPFHSSSKALGVTLLVALSIFAFVIFLVYA
jgi:hypothetical protein